MANNELTCVLDHVRKLIGSQRESELSDGQLLERFVGRRDEAAFETLVRRHGPMVQRVCRRVLNDAHAAEDAFQATFLVLARKAQAIRNRSSVGGWLYEVAYHLAVRARADAARRVRRERQAPNMPYTETVSAEEGREVYAVLDEELHRLPEKYRSPLVLCYLEGKSNIQAARELGWPTGSISSRLERARELLRDRLAGRGIALSTGGVAALLMENAATGAVAAGLVENTVRAAIGFAAGKSAVAGAVSAEALVLAEGMLNTMISTKLKLVAVMLLAVGLLGTGTSVWLQQGTAAQAPAAAVQPSSQPADGKKGDVYGDPLPEGALARMGTLRWRHPGAVNFVGYSAEGKEVVTGCQDGWYRVWEVATGKELRRFGKPGKVDPTTGQIIVEGNGGAVMAMPVYNNAAATALSKDGLLLAAGGQDGIVRLWETATGKELRTIGKAPQAGGARIAYYGAMSMAFAPDGKTLALRTQTDQTIKLFDTASGNELRVIGKAGDPKRRVFFGGASDTLAFSADGKTIATVITELENNQRAVPTIQLFETESGKDIRTIKIEQAANNFVGVGGIAFVPSTNLLAIASFDGTIHFHDVETGKVERKLGSAQQPGTYFSTMLFSPDGKSLATRLTNNPSIQLWNVADGKEIRQMGEQQAAAAGGNVQILIGRVGGGTSTTLAFSPDGKQLAEGLPSNSVRLWEVATGKEVPAVSGHQGGVSNMAVSPDGKVLTTRGLDNTVRQWDIATGKELRQFKVASQGNAILSSDGKVLACGVLNAVQLWDTDNGKELRSIAIQGQPQFGNAVGGSGGLALSPDGKTLAVKGFDTTIRLYDTASGKELNPIQEQVADPNNKEAVFLASGMYLGGRPVLAFSPDGQTLATVGAPAAAANPNGLVVGRPGMGAGNMIRLWSVSLGKQVRQFETVQKGISALTFAPDGRTIITANSDNTISVWETLTGKECLTIKLKADAGAQQPNPAANQGFVAIQRMGVSANTIAVSADGQSLAVGNDQTLRLFDLTNGKELGEFKGHQGTVLNVVFAADNQTVITGSADTTAVVWDGKRFIKKEKALAVQLEAKQLDDLWNDLAAEPTKGYLAVTALAAATKQVPAVIAERVKPANGFDLKKLDQMIVDLDSNKFDARQKATEDLEKLGDLAKPALEKVLAGQPALETRQRVERLLERLVTNAAPPADIVRAARAVWVLEKIGTPEAREVLQGLAKGAPGDKVTYEAETSLKRLAK